LRLFEVEHPLSRFATHRHIPPDIAASVRCAPVQDRIERLPELNLRRIEVLGLADEPDLGIRLGGAGDRLEPGNSAGGPAHLHDAAHGKPTRLASFDVDAEVVVALAPEKQLAGESVDRDWARCHQPQRATSSPTSRTAESGPKVIASSRNGST
jgi:hypothetical protein